MVKIGESTILALRYASAFAGLGDTLSYLQSTMIVQGELEYVSWSGGWVQQGGVGGAGKIGLFSSNCNQRFT